MGDCPYRRMWASRLSIAAPGYAPIVVMAPVAGVGADYGFDVVDVLASLNEFVDPGGPRLREPLDWLTTNLALLLAYPEQFDPCGRCRAHHITPPRRDVLL